MRPVAAAVRAVLLQLHPVRVVAPVLAGDVVAVLALLAGQRDLGPDVSSSHVECLSSDRNGRPHPRGLPPRPRHARSGRPTWNRHHTTIKRLTLPLSALL